MLKVDQKTLLKVLDKFKPLFTCSENRYPTQKDVFVKNIYLDVNRGILYAYKPYLIKNSIYSLYVQLRLRSDWNMRPKYVLAIDFASLHTVVSSMRGMLTLLPVETDKRCLKIDNHVNTIRLIDQLEVKKFSIESQRQRLVPFKSKSIWTSCFDITLEGLKHIAQTIGIAAGDDEDRAVLRTIRLKYDKKKAEIAGCNGHRLHVLYQLPDSNIFQSNFEILFHKNLLNYVLRICNDKPASINCWMESKEDKNISWLKFDQGGKPYHPYYQVIGCHATDTYPDYQKFFATLNSEELKLFTIPAEHVSDWVNVLAFQVSICKKMGFVTNRIKLQIDPSVRYTASSKIEFKNTTAEGVCHSTTSILKIERFTAKRIIIYLNGQYLLDAIRSMPPNRDIICGFYGSDQAFVLRSGTSNVRMIMPLKVDE